MFCEPQLQPKPLLSVNVVSVVNIFSIFIIFAFVAINSPVSLSAAVRHA